MDEVEPKNAARWGLRVLGVALALAACGFVTYRCVQTRFWKSEHLGPEMLTLVVGAGAVAYVAMLHLVALAWCGLVRPGCAPPRLVSMLSAYATTQIGKYIPGNIFHLAGRHALGRRIGLGHAALIAAAGGELALISLAAFLVSAPFGVAMSLRLPVWAMGAVAVVVVVTGISALVMRTRIRARWRTVLGFARSRGFAIVHAVALYTVFLALAGVLVWCVLRGVSGEVRGGVLPVIGAVALSWVAGFSTPGAPSGVGVREAVLIETLRGAWGEESATAAAVLFRVLTLAGDVLFFLTGLALRRVADAQSDEKLNDSTNN